MAVFTPTGTFDNKWMIGCDLDNFKLGGKDISFYFTSSYNIVPARILGFSYTDYLKWCRANGAVLRGNKGYTYPKWDKKNECEKICKIIEKEWNKVLAEFKN